MTEEEIKTEEETTETWTMDDLVALTDEVQDGDVDYRGKKVKFQFCELIEKEEPKFKPIGENASEEDKMAFYTRVGSDRIQAMITKANEKNTEGASINTDNWPLLPTTLRYTISNHIMGIEQESRENFTL